MMSLIHSYFATKACSSQSQKFHSIYNRLILISNKSFDIFCLRLIKSESNQLAIYRAPTTAVLISLGNFHKINKSSSYTNVRVQLTFCGKPNTEFCIWLERPTREALDNTVVEYSLVTSGWFSIQIFKIYSMSNKLQLLQKSVNTMPRLPLGPMSQWASNCYSKRQVSKNRASTVIEKRLRYLTFSRVPGQTIRWSGEVVSCRVDWWPRSQTVHREVQYIILFCRCYVYSLYSL